MQVPANLQLGVSGSKLQLLQPWSQMLENKIPLPPVQC